MIWYDLLIFNADKLNWYFLPVGFLAGAFVWYWNVQFVIDQAADKCGWGSGWVKETMETLPRYRNVMAVNFLVFVSVFAPVLTLVLASHLLAFALALLGIVARTFAMRPIKRMAEEAAQHLMSQAA